MAPKLWISFEILCHRCERN